MGPSSSFVGHHEFLDVFPATIFFRTEKQSVMSKSAQENTFKEGSAVAKPRPMNSVSRNLLSAKKTPPQDSNASNRPGNQELDQSSGSWNGRKLGRSGESTCSASTRKLERGDDIQIGRTRLEFTMCKSPTIDTSRKSSRTCGKCWFSHKKHQLLVFEALKANELIWRLFFMSSTIKAAIHLGPNYVEILEIYRNTNFEELQNFFDTTQKLILDHQAEILKVTTIDWTPSWTKSTLTSDQVITWTRAQVHVYSDFVLCLGKMQEHSEANKR